MSEKYEAMLAWAEKSLQKSAEGCELASALRNDALATFKSCGAVDFTLGGFVEQEAADVLAAEVLKPLSGLTFSQVRLVLRRAELLLDATSTFSAETAEFQAANEALLAAFGQQVAQPQR